MNSDFRSAKPIAARDRLIVALDVAAPDQARALVATLGDAVTFYNVGLELFMQPGCFELVEWLVRQGKRVFVDLKYFDVPETVRGAVRGLSSTAGAATGTRAKPDKLSLRSFLSGVTEIIGHNIAGFDIPVLERWIGGGWEYRGKLYDTYLVGVQRYFTTIDAMTWAHRRAAGPTEAEQEAAFPMRLMNKPHSLEAWGYRLGLHKGTHIKEAGVQEYWSQELEDYCARDVQITRKLHVRLQQPDKNGRPAPPYEAMQVESRFGYLLHLQEANGVRLDTAKANDLYATLCGRRDELTRELQAMIPAWYRPAPGKGDPIPDDLLPFVSANTASVRVPKQTFKVDLLLPVPVPVPAMR